MDSRTSRCLEISTARHPISESRFDDAAAELSIDVPGFMEALRGEPVVTKEQLDEFVAAISPQPQFRKGAAAESSIDVQGFVAVLRGEPVITKEQVDEFVAAISTVQEGTYDPAKHPRAPKGQPDGGQWVGKSGGASSVGGGVAPSSPFRTADFHSGQATAQIVAFGGAVSSWPTSGPMPSWLPKVDLRSGVGAGAASRTAFGVIAGALGNASMTSYWQRLSRREAMVYAWVYELEKRVQAGKLTREEAKEIFTTAVFGAHAQGFAPTGDRPSLVHKSAADFLAKAESVYFARKKKNDEWAKQPGGYQQSGGRVFPTEHNSGLRRTELRQEQEKFFERGLAEGKEDWYLRGQAANAGLTRRGTAGKPDDRLEDPEAEAALQRAMKKIKK